MKNKKSIYILLPVVLLIWGMVIYRFFSFSQMENHAPELANNFTLKPLDILPRDTSAINVNYRDPFLGKMYMPNTQEAKLAKKKPAKPKEPIVWPNIVYKGIVSDAKDKKKVFLVIINGQTFMMREKDTEQEVTIKSGNRKSIDVLYKGNSTKIMILE